MAQTDLSEGAILMAWAFAGIISLFGAFSLGGIASLTEESGGVYEYLQLSFGKFPAFLSGWADFMIVGPGAIAALGFLFAHTVNTIIPLPNPLESFEHISIANSIFPFADSGVKLVGIGAIVVLTGINCLGSHESGVINNIITSAKMIGLIILIFLGLTYTPPAVAKEIAVVAGSKSPEGMLFVSAFLTAMLGAFWAYDGWGTAPNISGEIINPKRNVPRAMAFGILMVMVIYLLVNYTYMRVLPLDVLKTVDENEIGAVAVGKTLLGNFGRILLLILIIVCVFGALNSNIVSVPRKYFRMAQEGYFFRNAMRIHPRFKTPYVALLYSMIWGCLLLVSGTFDILTDMVVFTGFLFFGLLSIAVIKLKRNGTIKAKVIGYPVIPIFFLVFCIVLSVNTIWVQPKQSLVGLLLILIGVPFYYYFKNANAGQNVS